MTENINSPAFKAKKKMYLLAPLVFIPFFAFLFDLFGGGAGLAAKTAVNKKSFDTSIPDAKVTNIATKDEAYIQADEENMKNSIASDFDINAMSEQPKKSDLGTQVQSVQNSTQQSVNPNKDVEQILEKYYRDPGPKQQKQNERYTGMGSYSGYSPVRTNKANLPHKELETQNDETKSVPEQNNQIFFGGSAKKVNGGDSAGKNINAFQAVVHGEQAISASGQIKMRTTEAVTINNIKIPSNTFIYGLIEIKREDRISIKINSIRYNQEVIPVNLSAYDADGQEGIFVSGGNLKEKTDQVIDGINAPSQLNNLPVIGNVAEATKNIFRKKRGTNAIIIGANYKLLIKQN